MIYELEMREVTVKVIRSTVAALTVYGLGIMAYKYLLRKYAEA